MPFWDQPEVERQRESHSNPVHSHAYVHMCLSIYMQIVHLVCKLFTWSPTVVFVCSVVFHNEEGHFTLDPKPQGIVSYVFS